MRKKIFILFVLLNFFVLSSFSIRKIKNISRVKVDKNLQLLNSLISSGERMKSSAVSMKRRINRMAVRAENLINNCKTPAFLNPVIYADIKKQLKRLGFSSGKITFEKNKLFKVAVTGYKPSSRFLKQNGRFRKFNMYVGYIKGKLLIVDKYLLKQNFKISKIQLNEASAISSLRTCVSSQAMFYQSDLENDGYDYADDLGGFGCFSDQMVDNVLGTPCQNLMKNAKNTKIEISSSLKCMEYLKADLDSFIKRLEKKCSNSGIKEETKPKYREKLNRIIDKASEGVPYIQSKLSKLQNYKIEYKNC